MPTVTLQDRDGLSVDIAYLDEGDGEPIVLVHGFASSKTVNWVGPGWMKFLTSAGYRVIALDNRGHGESSKFHASERYTLRLMAGDVLGLCAHLGLDRPHLMGYSMGARISTRLAIDHGEAFDRIILAGNGISMIEGSGDWTPVREALLAESVETVTDLRGRAFRLFADQTKSDRIALAYCVMAVRELFDAEEFASITNRVLVAIGSDDDIAGDGRPIADRIPNGSYLEIPGRDHMRAVGDKAYMAGVKTFLRD